VQRARAGGSAGTARAVSVRPEGGATAWLLRCAPGLATLLIAELRANGLADRRSKPSVLWQRNHDLVFLPRLAAEPKAGELRIAEEIHRCPVYGRYKISLRQLDVMAGILRPKTGHWHLVVTVDGNRYNRHELSRWLGRELRQRGATLDESAHRTAFLFCVEDSYYFCLPFRIAAESSQRGHRVAEREGSLPPTIAAAMAFLGDARDGETVLDPVCGSGTLLAEAFAYVPGIHPIGIDSDTAAIAVARRNLAHVRGVTLATGDAGATALPDASVGLFLANLPFGRQFGSRPQNRPLYHDIVREMVRLGRAEGWRAVLLTSDSEALEAAAADIGTVLLARASPVKVRGEAATIFMLRPQRSASWRP
jgi:predicted RNA methylase